MGKIRPRSHLGPPSFRAGQNISIYVSAFRPGQGGWVRLSALNVAGNGLAEAAIAHCPRPLAASASAYDTGGASAGGGLVPGCQGTLRGPSWRVMRNTVGAQWEFSGLPSLPLDLRLTDVDGREIIAWWVGGWVKYKWRHTIRMDADAG